MIFHFGFELPQPEVKNLDHTAPGLTEEEVRILKRQIQDNSKLISNYVKRLDLFVNKERYPKKEDFLKKIRGRLELLMEENDTFRTVLWKHYQQEDMVKAARKNRN